MVMNSFKTTVGKTRINITKDGIFVEKTGIQNL
jgi:hypothetical protein